MKKVCLILCAVLLVSVLAACEERSVGVIGGADGPTAVTVTEQGAPAEAAAETPQRITAEQAQQIAIKHAGVAADEVHMHEAEFDMDDGVPQYEVEFHRGATNYEYEIHAETGDVLSFEVEN